MSSVDSGVDVLPALLDRVMDEETGIVRFLSIPPVQSGEPPLFMGMAEMVDAHKLSPRRLSRQRWQHRARTPQAKLGELDVAVGTIYSSGAGMNREVALWSTVGEALERYAMNVHVPGIDIVASEAELPTPPIDISALILFDNDQYSRPDFPFSRYGLNDRRYWTPAVNLVDGTPTFIPAELVAANYFTDDAPVLDTSYSTGCAAGPTYARALFSGLCEVVERDGFMFYWLTATPPPRLDIAVLRRHLPQSLHVLLDFPNLDISLRWLRTDAPLPTVGCFIRPRTARGFACGASSNADWRVAVEKALIEAFHTLNWIVDLERRAGPLGAAENIKDFVHHVMYYLDSVNHAAADFLVRDDVRDGTEEFLREYDSIPDFRTVVQKLYARGYTPVAVDRTFDDLESVGIRVAHVFVPGLQPLHVGIGIEHRDRRRLERLAEFLGVPMPTHLNLEPHPFP
jgi:ribosomal protein S12 methylthiotransferase accessory factor